MEEEIEIASDIESDESYSDELPLNNADLFKLYQDNLNAIFNKVKYYYSKNQSLPQSLSSFISKHADIINEDKTNSTLNADKYFIYIKQSLEIEASNATLIDFILDKVHTLYKENLLPGSTYIPDKQTRVVNIIITSITKFQDLNEKSIWKTSLSLLKLIYCKNEHKNIITNESLTNILSYTSFTYSASTNNDIVELSKSIINDIVYKTFSKMDIYAKKNILKHNDFYKGIFDTCDTPNTNIALKCETPLSKFIHKRITCLVDQIVIASSSKSHSHQLHLVPLHVNDLINTAKYDKLSKVKVESLPDEEQPGYFGWCYICRKPSNYYDRETRLPVCSIECKLLIKKETQNIVKYFHNEIVTNEECLLYYFNTCVNIFGTLSKMVNSQASKNDNFNLKLKSLSNEILLHLLEQYGKQLNKSKDFINVIKSYLIENMLTNCVTEDHTLFKQTINLFFRLWSDFKVHLKQEIAVFNETVFLKILDSNNSSYEHKLCILENFEQQAKTEQYYVELYANYDCDKNEHFLVNRIVTVLGKIGQGKYLKGDHMLTSVQENTLKMKALQTLVTLVKSLYSFTMNHIKDYNGYAITNGINDIENDMKDNETFITENDSFMQVINTNIDKNIEEKNKYEKARLKFNIRFSKGINYLINEGLIDTTNQEQEAKDIANFMRMNLHLNKERIGEILGDNSQLNLKVLKYYTESFNFKNISFLQALRDYLFTFQLPGEGQKIDRILEAFGNKYNSDNVNAFENKDATYFLAFTIILLQTDMHNPNVKNKMDFDAYVNLTYADPSTKCISKEYLKEIYDDIKANPISLPEIEKQKEEKTHNKEDKIRLEALRILKEIKLRLRKENVSQYLTHCSFDYIKPLMNSLWTALLAVFSVILEETDNESLYTLCYEGMFETISLLSLLGLLFEKEAFVKALCKLTNLSQNKEILPKNYECIRLILQAAFKNAAQPLFNNCWKPVFSEVVSQLQFYLEKRNDKENALEKNKSEIISKLICNEFNSENNMGFFFMKVDEFDYVYLDDFVLQLCDSAKEDLVDKKRSFLYESVVSIMKRCISSKANSIKIWHKIWEHYSSLISALILDKNVNDNMKYLSSFIAFTKEYINSNSNNTARETAINLSLSFYSGFISTLSSSNNNEMTNKSISYIKLCISDFIQIYINEFTYINISNLLSIIKNCHIISSQYQNEYLFIFDLLKQIFDKVIKRNFSLFKKDISLLFECVKLFINEYPEKVLTIISDIVYLNINESNISLLTQSLHFFSFYYNDKRDNIHLLATNKLFEIIKDIIKQKTYTSSNVMRITNINNSFSINETFFNNLMDDVIIKICKELKAKFNDVILQKYVIFTFDLMKNNEMLFMKNNLKKLIHLIKTLCVDKEEKLAVAGTECLKIFLNDQNTQEFKHVIKEYPSMIYECLIETFEETEQKGFFTLQHEDISKSENISKYKSFITALVLKSILRYQIMTHIQTFLSHFKESLTKEQLSRLSTAFKESYEDAIRFNNNFELRKAIAKHYIEGSKNPFWLLIQQDTSIKEYFNLLNETHQVDEILTSAIEILNHFLNGVRMLDTENSFGGNDIDCERDDIDNEEYEDGEEIVEEEEEDKKEENENAQDKHNMVYHLMISLTNNVLPKLKSVKYWKYLNYRRTITELLIKCISCSDKGMKKLLQELLLEEFHDRYNKDFSHVEGIVGTFRNMKSIFDLYMKDEFNIKNIQYDKWISLNNFICFNAMLKLKSNSNTNTCKNLLLNMKYYLLFNIINSHIVGDVNNCIKNDFSFFFSDNIISSFFETLIDSFVENTFNYDDITIHEELLSTLLIIILTLKSSSFLTNQQIISVKKYFKSLYEILNYRKDKIKYINIFLIISNLLNISSHKQKTIIKNTKRISIHKQSSFQYTPSSFPKPHNPPDNPSSTSSSTSSSLSNEDIYKHLLKYDTSYLSDNSAYGPGRSITILIDDFFYEKISLLTPLKFHNYFSNEYFNLTAIGSTSLGLRASSTKNLDLVYLPNPKDLPYGKIEYLSNYLKTYYLGDKGFNTNSMDISYLSQGIIVLENYCRIHIWNVRYLAANKRCKELFKNDNSTFKKQIVFIYEMFRHLCFPRRKHIMFLYIAYLDCYYKIFDRSKRVFEIGRYASYEGNGKFSYLYERFYHYRINTDNLKYAEEGIDVKTHVVNFCMFLNSLVECCDNANEEFGKIPFEFYDGRYLFNLGTEMKLIVDKIERTDKAMFVNKMKLITEWVKAYSFLDYNQFFEKINALVGK